MPFSLAYPAANAFDWKPIVPAAMAKNISRNGPAAKQNLGGAITEALSLVGLSIGLLTLFAGLSLL